MSEKVKLIIEIPKYYLTHPKDWTCLAECVRRGIPLDDVLDKISAEIKERIADCEHGKEIVGDDFGIFALSIQAYSNVLEIVEKYKAEDEG